MNLKPAILVFALSALVAACDDSGTKAEAETGTSAATTTVESPAASSEASTTDQVPSAIDTADKSASTTPSDDKTATMAQLKSEMEDLQKRYEAAKADSMSYRKTWDEKEAAIKDAQAKNDTAAVESLTKESAEAKLKFRHATGTFQQLRDKIKDLNAKIVAAR